MSPVEIRAQGSGLFDRFKSGWSYLYDLEWHGGRISNRLRLRSRPTSVKTADRNLPALTKMVDNKAGLRAMLSMNMTFPHLEAGMKIGLFGGSFDPPHDGHLLVARHAMRHLRLHQIWWIPSHGNPLKANGPAPIGERKKAIEALIDDPKMKLVDVEMMTGSRFTIDNIRELQARLTRVAFVWICGADILGEFHHWRDWQEISSRLPVCAVARPGYQMQAHSSPFARKYRNCFFAPRQAHKLPFRDAPAWTLLTGPMMAISSTELRKKKLMNESLHVKT